jgi:hypothetical protein
VSFTFSSAETGTTYNYSFTGISGPAVSSSGTIISSGQQITGIDLSGLGDGTVTLTAYLTDSTGNQGVDATNQKTKDVTAPTVTDNAPSGWQASNITTTLTCSDGTGTSGCSRVYYTTDNTTPSDSTSSYVDATSSWQFTTSTEGNYILKYRGKDAAGNLEGAITATNHIQLDKTAPTGQGIDFATPVSPTELDVTASVPTDGAGSGLASSPYWFREITGGTGSSSSTDWQDTTIFTDSGLTPNTLYAYEVKVKDALANTSDYSGSVTGYTLAAVPGTIALTASSSAQITATWSANENPSGTQYYIENYTNSTNSDWTADTSWQSSGLSCGTTYSFRVKARNTAGTETSWSDTASKTTPVCGGGGLPASVYTPPAPSAGTSFGILINNGAQSASVRYVVLTLTAGSNVSRMSISNDPNFTNAVQEPFSQTKLWTLTDGQGQKTVYVEFFTSYGVASGTVFATISYTLSVKEPIANFVPEIAPTALQGLKIMSINPLGNFAVAPVKSDVGFFAEKVPQFKKALDGLAINVNAPADIKKLTQTQLYLPGLAQTLSANSMQVNSLAGIQAIPLAQLSPAALDKIPSNVVFARTAGELIDFSSALAIDNKGNTEQRISTISGKPMELVIKPDAPASRVIGLITLKSLAKIDNNIGQNNPNNPLSFVAGFFTAALTSVNTVPIAPDSSQAGLLVQKFNYDETQPGVFKAEINAPTTEGEYQVTTVVQYKDTALTPTKTSLIAVVDPEGYVYQQLSGGKLRIQNATVSIFWLNPDTKKYELWPAEKFLQKNPVVTDDTGKYSFLVPQGTYYLTASALNYSSYKSDKFIIKEDNGVRIDIGLKKQAFLPDWFSWQAVIAVLLLIITILLCVFSVIYVKGRKK